MTLSLQSLYGRSALSLAQSLMADVSKLPHGAIWYGLLPTKGHGNRAALRRKWATLLLHHMLPPPLIRAMLCAAILPTGKPSPTAPLLYTWLLVHLYSSDTQRMYTAWLAIKGG